jgi:hypothetical protein
MADGMSGKCAGGASRLIHLRRHHFVDQIERSVEAEPGPLDQDLHRDYGIVARQFPGASGELVDSVIVSFHLFTTFRKRAPSFATAPKEN